MTRKYGYGTVVERNGKLWVRVPVNGERRWFGPFATIEALDRAVEAIKARSVPGGCGVSLAEYGATVLARRRLEGRSNANSDEGKWVLHVAEHPLGKTPIEYVRKYHITEFVRDMQRKKAKAGNKHSAAPGRLVSRSTIAQALTLVRVVLQDAVDVGLLEENPGRLVKAPDDKRTTDPWTWLDVREQRRLITSCELPEAAIVAFAIYTGMRIGEMWSLHWEDVREDHVIVRYGGHEAPTKSGKPRRVGLLPEASYALGYWEEHGFTNCDDLVFPTVRGYPRPTRPLGVPKAPRHWKRWVKAAGIRRNVRFHDLRHTFATSSLCGLWPGEAWTLPEVAAQLGHSTTYVTERYGHLVDDLAVKAAKRRKS